MDDLIRRQAAIEAIKCAIWDKQIAKDAIDAVCNIPSTQPERKKGKWISDEDGNIYCSVCGRTGVGESFCEHCGANMKGEEE